MSLSSFAGSFRCHVIIVQLVFVASLVVTGSTSTSSHIPSSTTPTPVNLSSSNVSNTSLSSTDNTTTTNNTTTYTSQSASTSTSSTTSSTATSTPPNTSSSSASSLSNTFPSSPNIATTTTINNNNAATTAITKLSQSTTVSNTANSTSTSTSSNSTTTVAGSHISSTPDNTTHSYITSTSSIHNVSTEEPQTSHNVTYNSSSSSAVGVTNLSTSGMSIANVNLSTNDTVSSTKSTSPSYYTTTESTSIADTKHMQYEITSSTVLPSHMMSTIPHTTPTGVESAEPTTTKQTTSSTTSPPDTSSTSSSPATSTTTINTTTSELTTLSSTTTHQPTAPSTTNITTSVSNVTSIVPSRTTATSSSSSVTPSSTTVNNQSLSSTLVTTSSTTTGSTSVHLSTTSPATTSTISPSEYSLSQSSSVVTVTPTNTSFQPSTVESSTSSSVQPVISSSTTSRTSSSSSSTEVVTTTVSPPVASGSRDAVALGVGLGIGLGVPIIVILAVILFCCWRHRQAARRHGTTPGVAKRPLRSRLWPFRRWMPSYVTVSPSASIAGVDNGGRDIEDQVEMSMFIEPPERPSHYTSIKDLMVYIARRQSDTTIYQQEFNSLPTKNIKPYNEGKKSANDAKNRYSNILPYDDNRVVLGRPCPGNYINGSFIDGFRRKSAYIGTQGPIPKSFDDFWQMVWQYNCSRIVMVTNLEEGGKTKCHQYWPGDEGEPTQYGDVTVELMHQRILKHWTERVFYVIQGSETRTVTQYQYTEWPDQEAPVTCTSMLGFHHAVFGTDIKLRDRQAPVVVHCSAGVGRTGTFIAIDILLEQSKQGQIDIVGCIDKLRRQRMSMVQSMAQFIFIHHVMLEATVLDVVTIPCSEFNLGQLAATTRYDISTIRRQYDVLEAIKLRTVSTLMKTANNTLNQSKNRSSTVLPLDGYIMFLRPTADSSNVYINAVTVASWWNDKEYIASQMPLPTTTNDFWRLVSGESCSVIVMLNGLSFDERQYWPEDGMSIKSGRLRVVNVGEIVSDNIQVTDLEIIDDDQTQKRDGDSSIYQNLTTPPGDESVYENLSQKRSQEGAKPLTVRHIRPLDWQEGSSLPDNRMTLIDLCEQVFMCQQKSPDGKVLIHCLYGAERTGLFCALLNVVSHIQSHEEVDVFNAVKLVRQSRPEFVATLEQYEYLYEMVETFLASDYRSSADR